MISAMLLLYLTFQLSHSRYVIKILSASLFIFPYLSLSVHLHRCCITGVVNACDCYCCFLVMLIHWRQHFQQQSKQTHSDIVKITTGDVPCSSGPLCCLMCLSFLSQMVKQILSLQLQWSDSRTMFCRLEYNSNVAVKGFDVNLSRFKDSFFKAAIVLSAE